MNFAIWTDEKGIKHKQVNGRDVSDDEFQDKSDEWCGCKKDCPCRNQSEKLNGGGDAHGR